MKIAFVKFIFLAAVGLTMTLSVSATITSIKSDMCGNPECTSGVVQPVVRGSGSVSKISVMTVTGAGVDLSTGVSVSGEGVSAVYGSRTFGTGSSIVIQFSVRGDAPIGNRTVTMKYLVGTDTFTIRVIRGGTITGLRRVLENGSLVAPVNMPVNQPVTLRFAGTSIGNASIARNFDIGNKNGGCGSSETLCTFNVTFTRVGTYNINLIDNALPSQTSQSYSKFYYVGPDEISVVGQTTPSAFEPVRTVTGVSTPPPIDVAPRAFMTSLVRRVSRTTPNFTRDGFAYYRLASPENLCQGMTGTTSRRVTVANPTWGVTNIGGNVIPLGFSAQLRLGTQVVDTGDVPANLAAGASSTFTYVRPGDSLLSVFTFLDQLGCFVSPTAVAFFEDPTFTVIVDPAPGSLTESNEGNNSRVY